MLDVDLAAMRRLVEGLDYQPLFVTVSGAHLYGFPSSDSDVDLRGCHQLPLRDVVGLALPNQTLEHKIIDRHLPADPQAEFSHGSVLSLLIAARLFSPVALVNVGGWAADSGADILWDMPVEKINDDRLGRSVDAFFDQRHSISGGPGPARVAGVRGAACGNPLRSHAPRAPRRLRGVAAAGRLADRRGRSPQRRRAFLRRTSRQGRPMSDAPNDVQLIHAGLCTVVDEWGPLPIFGHTVSGNDNGHTAVAEQLALLRKHLRPPELTMISDRGTFSVGHLLRLEDAGYHAIVAAPWDEFRPLFDQQRAGLKWKRASYLSIEQQRRRRQGNLPQEHYELAVVRHELTEADSGRTLPCRVIFVFSTADQKVAQKNREKSVAKLRSGLEQIARSVEEGRRFTDPTAIARRVAKLFGQRQAAEYFRYEMLPLSKKEREQLAAAEARLPPSRVPLPVHLRPSGGRARRRLRRLFGHGHHDAAGRAECRPGVHQVQAAGLFRTGQP